MVRIEKNGRHASTPSTIVTVTGEHKTRAEANTPPTFLPSKSVTVSVAAVESGAGWAAVLLFVLCAARRLCDLGRNRVILYCAAFLHRVVCAHFN